VFSNASHIHSSLIFSGKAGAYQSLAPYGTQLLWLALSLAHKY
jgi:hypothetical protein